MWGSPYLAAQAAYLEHLGTARGAEVMESDGVYAVRTRVPSNAENGVLSCARAQVTRAIAEKLAGWFGEWNVPASWLCAEGIGRAGVAATLEAAGYRPERSSWEMRGAVHSVDLGGSAGHPALRIEPVSSERALGTLAEDEDKYADLIKTLDAFIRLHGSVNAVARDLFLHRNTVRQRLRRIAKLTGADLANSDDRLALQLALIGRRALQHLN